MYESFYEEILNAFSDDMGYGQHQTRRKGYKSASDILNEQLSDALFNAANSGFTRDFNDFMRRLGLDPTKPKTVRPKAVDPKARLAEIDKELDIIKGRVPTPKGYIATPSKVKLLIQERKEVLKRVGSN